MLHLIFKKSKIVLDCFTSNEIVYDTAKINYATKYYPEWWKQTPSQINDQFNTIKHCRAFIDYFKTGIVIPSWFELAVEFFGNTDPENRLFSLKYSNDFVDTSQSHDSIQFEKFALSNGKNIKLQSPWAFRTNKSVNFTWTQATWSMRNSLSTVALLPAVMDFKYQHHTHINFMLMSPETHSVVNIPALTPLVVLHPLTDKKIEIKNHLISKNEYNRIFAVEHLILNKNLKDETKEYEKKKELIHKIENINKCPFGKNYER